MKITLCGSTRFHKDFTNWNVGLTLAGHIVYSIAMAGREKSDTGKDGQELVTDEQKIILDLIHLRKIAESEAIVVLNVGGYIGTSTKREIAWARMFEKKVYWLETIGPSVWQIYSTNGRPLYEAVEILQQYAKS